MFLEPQRAAEASSENNVLDKTTKFFEIILTENDDILQNHNVVLKLI